MMQAVERTLPNESSAPAAEAFHSVLVPVDLTPISDRVLARVAQLPLAEDARVTLLHVVPDGLSASEQRSAEREADKTLREEMRHLRKLLPRRVRLIALVTQGSAAAEIAARANKLNAELIVMGRAGGRPLRDAFVGSTAERVIRQARVPVLAVRQPARGRYHRPALALELDASAPEVVRLLLRVLPPPRPPVDVIHAFETPFRGLIYPSLAEDELDEVKNELREKATLELEQVFEMALSTSNVRRVDGPYWRTHVRYGSPRSVVETVTRRVESDLLVVGSRGHSGAAYMLLGTVAGDLLRAAKSDVLVVPSGATGS